ncbi:gag/pol protein [Cucumis melo var. makuwa]|uniref:Gag/pol protein n=1 Tax=Cucumis melo var. makuwa TaxID=1194695 RepID=A0A5D3E0T2_CUCMM|nr:gag/pol protein [Cucumis melo var. makuwa]TYK29075.1 gag/pol protein [Cucumis melo var. makuwa]
MLATNKLNGNNYASWKNTINTVLTIDDLRFVQVEKCPQVPIANATRTVREAHECRSRQMKNPSAYILPSLSEVLTKKHESMLTAREIMDSLQEMFRQTFYQIKHDTLKYIYNTRMNEGSPVREHGQKGETNVSTSIRKFHRGSTFGTKSMPSSSGIKKWKKKKGCQQNKANITTVKTSQKVKVAMGIYFHCNQEGHWKRNCSKYLEEKKKVKQDLCGPMNVKSTGGFEYFITFIEDYSRYGYVYLMQRKFEALEKFKEYKAEVENALSKTIKTFRSDRGGELMDSKFKDYLMECGIVFQLSTPGTPQQNGVSEKRY